MAVPAGRSGLDRIANAGQQPRLRTVPEGNHAPVPRGEMGGGEGASSGRRLGPFPFQQGLRGQLVEIDAAAGNRRPGTRPTTRGGVICDAGGTEQLRRLPRIRTASMHSHRKSNWVCVDPLIKSDMRSRPVYRSRGALRPRLPTGRRSVVSGGLWDGSAVPAVRSAACMALPHVSAAPSLRACRGCPS